MLRSIAEFLLVVVATMPLALASASRAGDNTELNAFNTHCRNCHSFKKGDNRLGPSVYGIVGAKAGQNGDFRGYSGALSGIYWNEATLDRFLADPRSVAPGTTMIYPTVADPAERKKIIDFLKSLTGS